MTSGNPEIGVRIDCGGLGVNVHDQGSGQPVVLNSRFGARRVGLGQLASGYS